jgi:glutamate racemase
VIDSAVGTALSTTRTGRIGVIATQATIDSKAYERSLKRGDSKVKVFQSSCPLFVPLVEEGWWNGQITAGIARTYLEPLLKKKIDTLILGCTHYPLLRQTIQKVAGPGVRLVDSIEPTVEKLATLLVKKDLSCLRHNEGGQAGRRDGDLRIYVSDSPRNFVKMGETFLGQKMKHVEVVRQK